MTSLIGFEDITERQKNILKAIHILAKELEKQNNSGKAHPRIAMIEELTKEPTSFVYMREKLEMLFDRQIKE